MNRTPYDPKQSLEKLIEILTRHKDDPGLINVELLMKRADLIPTIKGDQIAYIVNPDFDVTDISLRIEKIRKKS